MSFQQDCLSPRAENSLRLLYELTRPYATPAHILNDLAAYIAELEKLKEIREYLGIPAEVEQKYLRALEYIKQLHKKIDSFKTIRLTDTIEDLAHWQSDVHAMMRDWELQERKDRPNEFRRQ